MRPLRRWQLGTESGAGKGAEHHLAMAKSVSQAACGSWKGVKIARNYPVTHTHVCGVCIAMAIAIAAADWPNANGKYMVIIWSKFEPPS